MQPPPVVHLDLDALAEAPGLPAVARALWPALPRAATVALSGAPAQVQALQRALLARFPLPMVRALRLVRPGPGARPPELPTAELLLARLGPPPAPAVHRDSPAWAGAQPALSVVVPTFRRFDCLEQLLRLLEQQQGAPPFELIIVDDGSPEGLAAWPDLSQTPLPVRMMQQPNQGPAAARNLALAHVRAPVLVSLNDDAVPPPDLLAGHAGAWQDSEQADVAMGTFTLTPAHRRDSFAELVETTNLLFPQPTLPGPGPFPGLILCTGNCSLPTRWLREVGGFDTWFTKAGGEDSELGRRMHAVDGHRVRFLPELACGHDHALTVSGFARRQEHLGRCVVYLARRWGDPRIVTGDPKMPIQGAFLEGQRRLVQQGVRALQTLPARLDARCAEERAAGALKGELAAFEAMVRKVGRLGFARGVVGEWDQS
jgi:GT2 family glycosyltransferase